MAALPRAGVAPALVIGLAVCMAVVVGLLAAIDPRLAFAGAVGVIYVAVVLDSLLVGVATLALASYVGALGSLESVSLVKVAGLLLALSWLALVLTRGREELYTTRPVLLYLLALFLVWVVGSTIWAEDTSQVWFAVRGYGLNLLLFPIVYSAVRSVRDLRIVLAVLVLGAFVAAVGGLLDPPETSGNYLDPGRAGGTLGDANELAAASVVGVVLAFGITATRISVGARALLILAAGLALLSVFTSLSRGGLVSLGAALVAAVFVSGRWRPRVALVAGLTLVGTVLYFGVVATTAQRDRVTDVENSSGRSDLWNVGLRMVEDHPLVGVGAGNFRVQSRDYLVAPGTVGEDRWILSEPVVTHNTFLQVAAELGLIGFVIFMSVIFAALWTMLRAARAFAARGDPDGEVLARAVFVAAVGLLAAGFFVSANYWKILWLVLALGPPALAIASRRSASGELMPRAAENQSV